VAFLSYANLSPLPADELLPREGKDETYDEIQAEIDEVENSLENDLKKFKKSLGCAFLPDARLSD